jgi:hypothetical protein
MSSTSIETGSAYVAEAESPVSEFSVDVGDTIAEHAPEMAVIADAADGTSIQTDVSSVHVIVSEDGSVREPTAKPARARLK